ncbi:MAG: DUF1574 family protein [Leptospirales bacterium]|nr:DUF1574 family protein [Leptospirales bacterium]
MEWIKSKFLLTPLVLFVAVFAIDKLFLLQVVRDNLTSWKKIEPPFYASRYDLYDLYRTSLPQHRAAGLKTGIILGSSRSAEFNSEGIEAVIHKSRTYNFSAPFACPSYWYYWLRRMEKDGVLPDYVILESDGIIFNERAIEYSLGYSYDSSFVFNHIDWDRKRKINAWQRPAGFSFDEAETFFLKKLFAMYRFPPDPRLIRENNESMMLFAPGSGPRMWTPIELRNHILSWMGRINTEKLGGIPNLLSIQLPPDKMKEDAENMAGIHLAGYAASPTQISFYKQMLRTLYKQKVPTVLYYPVMSDVFKAKQTAMLPRDWVSEEQLETELRNLDPTGAVIRLVNPDRQLRCRTFVDSLHLSGSCFPEVEKLLLQQLPLQPK